MAQKVYIELFDRLTQTKTMHSVTLPIQIGKSVEASNDILLDAKYETISRIHGRIEEDGDQFLYVDDSTNGSSVNGVLLKGAASRISKKDVIRIQNYNLRFVDVEPLIVKHTLGDLTDIGARELLPGMDIGIKSDSGSLTLEDFAADDAQSDWIAKLRYASGDEVTCAILAGAQGHNFKVNNIEQPDQAFDIKAFDVLSINGNRFEVLKFNEPKIVCGNEECHLLNDLNYEEGCQWCGFHLTAAGGRTRVVKSATGK